MRWVEAIMCIFTQAVHHVGDTRIFARRVGDEQRLAYQMHFAAAGDVAMVLPLPVALPVREDALRFIDLEAYPALFRDLDALFEAAAGGFGPVPQPAALAVHQVGAFEASFVPTMADFERLDRRFRVAPRVWRDLPEYHDWGFAVFKLKPAREARRVHPMAFAFRTRLARALYFPTRHVHDGSVRPHASFDHELYCQTEGVPTSDIGGWSPSFRSAASTVDAGRSGGLVDGNAPCFRFPIRGTMENRDFYATPQ
jgi:hypothetical protein